MRRMGRPAENLMGSGMNRLGLAALALAAALGLGVDVGASQVPPDLAAKIKAIGPNIDPSVGKLYAPLLESEPWPDVNVVRDQAYGSDPLQKLDVFTPKRDASSLRPVLLFVHGGGFVRGDKHNPGTPFTDNQLVWAVRHGMVGVNINYRLAPKDKWPSAIDDLASAITWTRAHIKTYGGNPDRIILWGHSAGANHVADYVIHADKQGPEAAGVKGAILLSPFYGPAVGAQPHAYYGSDPALQTQAAALAGLVKSPIPLFLAGAEYDPAFFQTFRDAAHDALNTRPGFAYVYLKDHDHLSEGFAVGTKDVSLTDPMLKWIKARR